MMPTFIGLLLVRNAGSTPITEIDSRFDDIPSEPAIPDPTEEEIRRLCGEVQSGWTETTRRICTGLRCDCVGLLERALEPRLMKEAKSKVPKSDWTADRWSVEYQKLVSENRLLRARVRQAEHYNRRNYSGLVMIGLAVVVYWWLS